MGENNQNLNFYLHLVEILHDLHIVDEGGLKVDTILSVIKL